MPRFEPSPLDRLMQISMTQAGVFTLDQARSCGFSPSQVSLRCRRGEWERLMVTVYRVRGTNVSWEGKAVAALLWAGSGSCLSHGSAARIFGLPGFEEDAVSITTPSRLRPVSGIKIHRTTIGRTHIVRKGVICHTSAARTLLDLSRVCTLDHLESALDQALLKRIMTIPRLIQLLEIEGSRGRKGAGSLKALVEQRDPSQRPTESQLERLTLRTIRAAGLPLPGQQKWISDSRGRFARVDFIYEEQRIIIEVDSFTHHSSTVDWSRDMQRRNRLTKADWKVFHATYWDLKRRPESLTEWLREVLPR